MFKVRGQRPKEYKSEKSSIKRRGDLLMAGTAEGGLKARDKNVARDPDFYRRIGAIGGSRGRGYGYTGGFAHPDADPASAGRKGGQKSRRRPKHQTSMFDVGESIESDVYRTKAGALSSRTKKAIAWYAIEHGLRLTAASAYPVMFFKDPTGAEVQSHITEIVDTYEKFKASNHGKRKTAA